MSAGDCDRLWELWCRCSDIPNGQALRCKQVGINPDFWFSWACVAP